MADALRTHPVSTSSSISVILVVWGAASPVGAVCSGASGRGTAAGERLRDLAAEGHIQAILIHSPDRLSRKYAYQVLLTEEFARHGVETTFLKAPRSGTPEDQLMLQFQGMIAEYERAQILERSRRGKRHRAKAGEVSVLCGAPYGYRYIRRPAMRRRATGSTAQKRRSCGWCTTNIRWTV